MAISHEPHLEFLRATGSMGILQKKKTQLHIQEAHVKVFPLIFASSCISQRG